ncbi:prepilin peptidase [Castellaniella sp.]|uniref:prepilin peptidase n=1 Tax=Castellaniella sp. TaxID=1955812 RepID=UPI002AFDDAF2|nr:prepilin peptidase [Castellaniella sp.]
MLVSNLGLIAFTITMMLTAIWDARTLRIPHRLNFATATIFIITAALSNMPAGVLLQHIIFALALFIFFFVASEFFMIGGGDIWLSAAIGLWIGDVNGVLAWSVYSTLIASILIVTAYVIRQSPLRHSFMALEIPKWAEDIIDDEKSFRKATIPYGVPLALGAICWAWL